MKNLILFTLPGLINHSPAPCVTLSELFILIVRGRMAQTADLVELLETRVPRARQDLLDSYKNLEGLADYCERNYVETQTKESLQNTKQYAAQSLASVAYQVNVLATNMLELLDLQTKHMVQMESKVRHISQVTRPARGSNY